MLLSAGVGITPLLSMLLSVLKAQPDREVFFVHGALNGRVHASGTSCVSLPVATRTSGFTIVTTKPKTRTGPCAAMIAKGSSTRNYSKICCQISAIPAEGRPAKIRERSNEFAITRGFEREVFAIGQGKLQPTSKRRESRVI
jgi:Oxidoreductase NAD-binding domain